MLKIFSFTWTSLVFTAFAGAASPALIRSDYKKGELAALCVDALKKAGASLEALPKQEPQQRTFDSTVLSFEKTLADLSDETSPLAFIGSVGTQKEINEEGSACEEKMSAFNVDVFSRRDLYNLLKDQKPRNKNEKRLLEKTLESFEQAGMKLSDEKLAQVRDLQKKLSQKETQFSMNLNQDNTTALFSAEELDGVPADAMARFKKVKDKFEVTTKSTDYVAVMENAHKSETRKKMLTAYLSRGGEANSKLLEEALSLRSQIAQLLGEPTWAAYRTKTRMAKNPEAVSQFLENLKSRLAKRNRADLDRLLKFKKELDPQATELNHWDLTYLANQIQKRDYQLDSEKIREYFPADQVVNEVFKIYSKLLGVDFVEVTDSPTWAEGVKLFEVKDHATQKRMAYFYADFFPRPNKYGHAAAFPLISGRLIGSEYSVPVASIVSNFTPPGNGKPSLLTHDEVETFFHEFGHIMHQTLTRAPYASLSGTSVARDFVEAPSQMLENWAWSPKILDQVSGHYQNPKEKLPKPIVKKLLEARDFNKGVFYTRQLLYGLFDLKIHTLPPPIDTTKMFQDLFREYVMVEPLPGGRFPASFGHLMGGYDAGYYGYLWSEVYAQDMFSKFPQNNLTDPQTGMRYRKSILEKGNMQDPQDLLKEFLGRKPKTDAFFKLLKI